ncbi:MAG TPA: hypothetical protein VF221_23090 [Chloroflexota bacterium]
MTDASPDALLALALRLLEEPSLNDDEALVVVSPTLTPGMIPDGITDVLPVPPDSVVLGTGRYPEEDGRGSIAVLDCEPDIDRIMAFYEGALRDRGWFRVLFRDATRTPEDEVQSASYVKPGDEREIVVQVWPGSDGLCRVRLQLADETEQDQETVVFDHLVRRLVGDLTPPGLTELTADSQGQIWHHTRTGAVAASGRTAASLTNVYKELAGQLEALGWRHSRHTREEHIHRSRWIVQDEQGEEWIVYLILQEAPGAPKLLLVSLEYGPGVDYAFR